jgi:transcriptional regulator of NAD metabolism
MQEEHNDESVPSKSLSVDDKVQLLAIKQRKLQADFDELYEICGHIVCHLPDDDPNYSFTVPALPLISLSEIAEDVTRRTPIATVVVKGQTYKGFHYLLIHDAIILKAQFLLDQLDSLSEAEYTSTTDTFIETTNNESVMKSILSELQSVSPTVHSYVLSESEFKLRTILDALNWVKYFPLRRLGQTLQKIVVTFR